MFLFLFCILSSLCFIVDYLKRRKVLAPAKNLPSTKLPSLPFLGHSQYFIGNDEDRMPIFKHLGREATELGGITHAWLGLRLFVIVSDPTIAEVILKSCLEKDDVVNYVRDLTGNGVIFAPGKDPISVSVHLWRPRRKVLASTFSPKTLSQFYGVFSKQSDILVQQLGNAGSSDFPAWKYLATYTMDTICETNLGVSVAAQMNQDNCFLQAMGNVAKVMAARVCQPWLQLHMIYRNTRFYKVMEANKRTIYDFIDQIVSRKRLEISREHEEKENSVDIRKPESQKPLRTFLEMLIRNSGDSEGYTNLELREEALVIALAGTDTSAVGIAFTLSLLARYPEVQEKVHQEIHKVIGESNRATTQEDLSMMPYLDAVIRESLRLYPPAPVIVRKVGDKPLKLESGATLLPGVGILINIWAINRNPAYWGEDAEAFRPERFLESTVRHPVAFLSFSYGPRNCLGYKYAMLSNKTAVAAIIKNYIILPPSLVCSQHEGSPSPANSDGDLFKVKFGVMMKDVDDFVIRLKKRVQVI